LGRVKRERGRVTCAGLAVLRAPRESVVVAAEAAVERREIARRNLVCMVVGG